MKCDVKNCPDQAVMDSPANLCAFHWSMWFCCDVDDPDEALKRIIEGEKLSVPSDLTLEG